MCIGMTVEQDLSIVTVCWILQVSAYNVHGQKTPLEFSLGQGVKEEGVADCCVYGAGVVALTNDCSIWVITDLHDPRPQKLADTFLDSVPQCMEVTVSPTHGVEVSYCHQC